MIKTLGGLQIQLSAMDFITRLLLLIYMRIKTKIFPFYISIPLTIVLPCLKKFVKKQTRELVQSISTMKFPLLGLLLLVTLVGSPTRAEEGPVCPKTDTLSRASFPEGFMFGTATASYQVYRGREASDKSGYNYLLCQVFIF